MEIRVTDLMVGDWLMFNDKPCQVKGLHNDDTVTLTGYRSMYYLIDAEPIPLTPEILEKNGFEKIDNRYPFPTFRCDGKENYLCITIGFPEGDKTKRKRPFLEIDGVNIYIGHLIINFVHQLQHALRLCGIDKEIVV